MNSRPRSTLLTGEEAPRRSRRVETALLLLLACATAFNWQNLKSIDAWLLGVVHPTAPAVPPAAAPLAGQKEH